MYFRLVRYLGTFVLLTTPFSQAQILPPEVSLSPPATRSSPPQAPVSGQVPVQVESVPVQSEKISIYVRSDTVYMKSATMRSWLQRQLEFNELDLAFASNQNQADYYVEITRPLFTWDWTYCVVKTRSGKIRGSGKVTAATAERAAKALAPRIIQVLYGETSASDRRGAAEDVAPGTVKDRIQPKRFVAYEELARKFESARTFSIHSATVWFEERNLEQALQQRPEFSGWGYVLITAQPLGEKVLSDLTIEINRPLFTWDWTYSIQDRGTGQSLASGKVTAISGAAAAPMLAKVIVGTIANSRGLPAPMQRQFDQALGETKVRSWEVRHISGQSHLETGKKIKLAVGQNTIFARDGDNILFSVPVEDLLQFSYSSNLRDRSVKWFQAWEKAGNSLFGNLGVGDDPGGIMGAAIVAGSWLAVEYGVGSLLKGSTTTDYFLILHWRELAGLTRATFQGSEQDVREICDELQKLSKVSAVDLDVATDKTRRAIEQGLNSTSYYIETEQKVVLEKVALPPGKYRVVFLKREDGLAEVSFLHPPDNAIVAHTVVEYQQRTNTDRSTRIRYGTLTGLPTFQEIQIEEHILRFSPVPIFPEEI